MPGTDLPGLIARLAVDPESAVQTLGEIMARVRAQAAAPTDSPDLPG